MQRVENRDSANLALNAPIAARTFAATTKTMRAARSFSRRVERVREPVCDAQIQPDEAQAGGGVGADCWLRVNDEVKGERQPGEDSAQVEVPAQVV